MNRVVGGFGTDLRRCGLERNERGVDELVKGALRNTQHAAEVDDREP